MPQTPKSVSAIYNSSTPLTLYTVPAGATAIVKTVIGQSLISAYDAVTVNKVSGGVTYPIVSNRVTGYPAVTAYPSASVNLLAGPITLGAGDVLSISTQTAAAYKFPTTVTAAQFPGYRVNNINYLNGKYIAVGLDNSNGNGLVLTSTDAVTWTKQNFPFGITLSDIAFDGTNYVVVGTTNSGYLYYSTNLTSWTQVAAPNSTDMHSITFGNGKFVSGGVSGVVWYATTPTSWSTVTLPTGAYINSVLTIGTSWAFGTQGAYSYTSDLVNFTSPYFFKPTTAVTSTYQSFALDANAQLYVANSSGSPSANPTTALWYSQDNGKTFTAYDLSALGSLPTNPAYPFAFGNGGRMAWMQTHPGNSRYLASADGITWTSQAYTGTNGTANGVWYSMNGAGIVSTTYNYLMSNVPVGGYGTFQIGTVSSSGVYTLGLNFPFTVTNLAPVTVGYGAMAASPFDGSWVYASLWQGNPNYIGQNWGTSATNGADGQLSTNLWYIPSYQYGYSACARPGRTGYIFGTGTGRLLYTATYNSTDVTATPAVMPDGGVIQAITASGTSTTSKVLAVTNNGYIAGSTNGGISWTYLSVVPGSYTSSYLIGGNKCLQYASGLWMLFPDGGAIYYSTDGITWNGNPLNIDSMFNLNSNNIFLRSNATLTYTAGTSLDVFVTPTTTTFGSFPSIRRMAYVSGTYLIGNDSTISSSTDLTTWTTLGIASNTINNIAYFTPLGGGATAIAYSGSGSSIVVGNALKGIGANTFSMGQPTVLASSLVTGAVTAGIVEIT